MRKVLIAAMHLANYDGPHLPVLVEAGLQALTPAHRVPLSEDHLIEELQSCQASLAGSERYSRRVIESSRGLRIISRMGVGYDAVDLEAATEAGIAVTITAGSNQEAVAEHAFALMLALAKSLMPHHHATRAGDWPRQITLPLRRRTLGVIGLGRTGQAVARRARAFGMRLIATEPVPNLAFVQGHEVLLVPLDQLLIEADFVSLHVPLNETTRNMINERALALMKPTAFLINTSRGGVVREADLVHALQAGRLAGAGLDVFEREPVRTGPLLSMDNVIVTPHTAGGDQQSRADMAMAAAQNVVAFSRGEWPADNIVNPEVRPRCRW